MVFLSFMEIFDILVMSLIIGFIFKDLFRQRPRMQTPEDFIKNVTPGHRSGSGWKKIMQNDYWFAVLLVAPAIIFHEFGHKFVAMAFGLEATFNAAYTWLILAVVLKLLIPGFVFLVPAYVSIIGNTTAVQSVLISFAGPGINLLFWLSAAAWLRWSTKKPSKAQLHFLILFKRINMILFIFNMLPIPGFDGWHIYSSLFALL